jgi:DNA-3-methyladenine glycosylase II
MIREELAAKPVRYDIVQNTFGIGRWTVDVHRILILKETDVMPQGDLGLRRAIYRNYSAASDLAAVSESWRPFRSVACWYLWRSLGNLPIA